MASSQAQLQADAHAEAQAQAQVQAHEDDNLFDFSISDETLSALDTDSPQKFEDLDVDALLEDTEIEISGKNIKTGQTFTRPPPVLARAAEMAVNYNPTIKLPRERNLTAASGNMHKKKAKSPVAIVIPEIKKKSPAPHIRVQAPPHHISSLLIPKQAAMENPHAQKKTSGLKYPVAIKLNELGDVEEYELHAEKEKENQKKIFVKHTNNGLKIDDDGRVVNLATGEKRPALELPGDGDRPKKMKLMKV
jgi:hypothetical protein